jgi:hypothetical protein
MWRRHDEVCLLCCAVCCAVMCGVECCVCVCVCVFVCVCVCVHCLCCFALASDMLAPSCVLSIPTAGHLSDGVHGTFTAPTSTSL